MTTTTRTDRRRTRWLLSILLTAMVPAWTTICHAATIVVNDMNDLVVAGDGRCTLREAVSNANLFAGGDLTAGDCSPGDPGGDTIRIPPGNYALSLAGTGEDGNASGDLDLLDDLLLAGSGSALTLIDGLALDRVLDAGPGSLAVSVEILEPTLISGSLPGGGDGGGLRVGSNSRVTMLQCNVLGNQAARGGGAFNAGLLHLQDVNMRGNKTLFPDDGGAIYNLGNLEIFGGIISGNTSLRHGAGVYNGADLFIEGTEFSFNSAAASGGCLYNDGFAGVQGASFTVCDAADGGAMFHAAGILSVEGSLFIQNSATGTGGTIASSADFQLLNSEVHGSIAFGDGGAIHHRLGLMEVHHTQISGNLSGGSGGGIWNRGILEAQELQLVGNQGAVSGGGLFNQGTAVLDTSSVDSNFGGDGAGIYNERILIVNESLIAHNQGSNGAGLFTTANSDASLLNSTLSDNHAFDHGGGAYVVGTLRLEFSTVALNEANASPSGGLFNAGDVRAKNTLFQRNSDDCLHLGTFTSFGYNMDLDGSCALTGVGDLSGVNANLGPLQNNGGPTETHELLAPSPAIDSADPLCLDQFGSVVRRDERGVPRPQDGDGNGTQICDRGAFELVLPSGPIPPVPDGIFGSPMQAAPLDPAATELELTWDVLSCPASGYHLLYGDLSTLDTYAVSGSVCGLSTSGTDIWSGAPAGNLWFLLVSDDAALTEGSWGDSSSGPRNGIAPSNECLLVARTNAGTCP